MSPNLPGKHKEENFNDHYPMAKSPNESKPKLKQTNKQNQQKAKNHYEYFTLQDVFIFPCSLSGIHIVYKLGHTNNYIMILKMKYLPKIC